jgi:hypothetical protein
LHWESLACQWSPEPLLIRKPQLLRRSYIGKVCV